MMQVNGAAERKTNLPELQNGLQNGNGQVDSASSAGNLIGTKMTWCRS